MPGNFNYEAKQITNDLKLVNGYVACERIIIKNIIKHFEGGFEEISIENYLKKLSTHLEYMMETASDNNFRTNYSFAVGFLSSLLKRPAWKSWLKTIET